MMNKKILLLLISSFMINGVFAQYCDKARNYTNEDKQIQAFSQDFYMYKCACSEEGLSKKDLEKKVIAAMTYDKNSIQQLGGSTAHLGNIPSTCKIVDRSGNSGGSSSSNQTNAQQGLMKSFANYDKAMGLKNQGVGIAKAFSNQVKNYSQLNKANTPQALLQNFNKNMQAISELQAQNKADNLNQVGNTLNSALNDLNSGNHEGAIFSTLSLIDQGEARREAKRKAEYYRASLIRQAQEQMSGFYWKAIELNDQTIEQLKERAAYAFDKNEEDNLFAYIENLKCHKESMKNNFSYSNTLWLKNNCPEPQKTTSMANNLIPRDVQHINAAKRKYDLYLKTGETVFQKGAMRFAGMATTENPKIDYYYLMGHFAGTNNPLVAYASFLTTRSINSKYFIGDRSTEYFMVKMSLESSFKNAINENNHDVIANIVAAGLHQAVTIDGYLPIVYAISIDKADVVQAFLNTELEGKSQSIITQKVRETIMLAAMLDAPNTLERFSSMGFGVDFELNGNSPLSISEQNFSISTYELINNKLGSNSKYNTQNSNTEKIIAIRIASNESDSEKVLSIFNQIDNQAAKNRAYKELLFTNNRNAFFKIYNLDSVNVKQWAKYNHTFLLEAFLTDIHNLKQTNCYKYIKNDLLVIDGLELNEKSYNYFKSKSKDGFLLYTNLFEFTVFRRRDLKLAKELLARHSYQKSFKTESKEDVSIQYTAWGTPISNKELNTPYIHESTGDTELKPFYWPYLSTTWNMWVDEQNSIRVERPSYAHSEYDAENDFELLKLFLFDSGFSDHYIESGIGISGIIIEDLSEIDSEMKPYFRKLMELIVEKGYQKTKGQYNGIESSRIKEYAPKEDQKYYKSIIKR